VRSFYPCFLMIADHFQLEVKSEINALQQVLYWFERFIMPLLPKQLGWQCELALTEAFTNAVRHAHRHLPSNTPIELEVEIDRDSLEMRVWDWGIPFDLDRHKQNSATDSLDSWEKEGGRGLDLIDRLTDELYYFREDDRRNCLVMRKKIEPEK
jgi:serine/threonine-protein kinase RsbW